jgi:hypothetical protein
MPKAIMVVPFSNGSAQFPGVNQETDPVSWVCSAYVPPPPGAAPYALVMLNTTNAAIILLSGRADCLFICNVLEDGSYEPTPLTPTQRNDIRAKIAAMGFTGAQYGLLNAAIQASQNRSVLAFAIATKAFYRNINKDAMTDSNLIGAYIT